MDDRDPETGKDIQKLQVGWVGLTMPITLPDILSSDGELLSEYNLNAVPVFDGSIYADGRLYIALADGKIVCFEQE